MAIFYMREAICCFRFTMHVVTRSDSRERLTFFYSIWIGKEATFMKKKCMVFQ